MAMVESPKEERILVSVRVRPLNEKEVSRNDVSEWACVGNTVVFTGNQPDRTMTPSSYAFDRVFGWDSSARQVYEQGAKEVALSVMSGINSTIFAYGQTSSGKTYTMKGISEFAITDIYDHIEKHSDKEFVLKFSAMEIYNEAVRDLLSSDTSAQLRLLDDPEKGTIIEKLTEEILSDRNHLQQLLSICEAQRKTGETSLNETSSRSHQILRLTVESSAREYLGLGSSGTLAATVNFVDLAGSERVFQALSAGARLKEGCHINRSLLTLGTVIRKLSKGKNGHVPYRESKLTRILQNSLGGNARTAIICTMSPARSHAEQSKNTLFFASCAKEVTTNAKVNVVTSDKALVKQLQKELAKMETAMKSLESNSLKEKERLLEQMDREIKELTRQRDLAQSRAQNLLQSNEGQAPRIGEISGSESLESHNLSSSKHNRQLSEVSEESFVLDSSTGFDLYQGLEDIAEFEDTAQRSHAEPEDAAERCDAESEESCKEITCIQLVDDKKETKGNLATTVAMHEDAASSSQQVEALQQKINVLQKTINTLVSLGPPLDHSPCSSEASAGSSSLPRSRSCKATLMSPSASPSKVTEQNENATPAVAEGFRQRHTKSKPGVNSRRSSREDFQASILSCPVDTDNTRDQPEAEDNTKPEAFQQKNFKSNYGVYFGNLTRNDSDQDSLFSLPLETEESRRSAGGEDIVLDLPRTSKGTRWSLFKSKPGSQVGKPSRTSSQLDSVLSAPIAWKVIPNFSESDLEDNVSLLNYAEEQNEDKMYAASSRLLVQRALRPNSNWHLEFERQRGLIIELWDACMVPMVHRTHFFLLYKGDPSDSLYLEVELRRLSILKDTFINGSNVKDRQAPTPASSMKAIKREREMLSKKVHKRFSKKERERVYQKWGIRLNTKQRSLQLANFLWTSTMDMGHIRESAALVAKLVGFVEPLEAPKEILGLSFLSRPIKKTSIWRDSMSTL